MLQHPLHTQHLCEAMAEKFKNAGIETVVGPMTGGILLAHETGKALGTRAIFTERVAGRMTFRRGFTLRPGERVLIVEDIVTTGGSIKEVIDVVKSLGAVPVAVSMLVDRSGGKADFGDVPKTALLTMDVESYAPEECPLCRGCSHDQARTHGEIGQQTDGRFIHGEGGRRSCGLAEITGAPAGNRGLPTQL